MVVPTAIQEDTRGHSIAPFCFVTASSLGVPSLPLHLRHLCSQPPSLLSQSAPFVNTTNIHMFTCMCFPATFPPQASPSLQMPSSSSSSLLQPPFSLTITLPMQQLPPTSQQLSPPLQQDSLPLSIDRPSTSSACRTLRKHRPIPECPERIAPTTW